MSSSRDLIRKAIRYKGPERIPVTNFIIDWQRWINERSSDDVKALYEIVKVLPEDSFYLDYRGQKGCFPYADNREYKDGVAYDEWGVGWIIKDKIIQRHIHPMKDSWALLDGLNPDPHDPVRFEKSKVDIVNKKDKYVLARVFFTIFERMWFIRSMENMLVDHITDTENFLKLRDKIVEFDMKIIDHWIEIGVDGIFFSDDWGSQNSLFINPNDWRKYYKPCYKALFDKVKSAGIDVWMHLDGNITEIIPDLIEVGLDVYNPVQNQVNDIRQLGKLYGGKLCFNGGVDVQETLPHGTPEQIKEEVDMMVDVLGSANGGFVMAASHTVMPDTPLKNMEALVEAMIKYTGSNTDT